MGLLCTRLFPNSTIYKMDPVSFIHYSGRQGMDLAADRPAIGAVVENVASKICDHVKIS